jgi:hypothetical protein
MAFPTSPTNGSTTTVNGIVYSYSTTDNAWTRLSTSPGNLTVIGNLTSSGNLIAANVYLGNIAWANGVPLSLSGTYSNTNVAAYLTDGTISITNLSVGDSLVQQDVLNLNNNNIYGVNNIRIDDPGNSEGISWEGGSGWSIYESPNDLSNATGNLQVVLSGTRAFTIDTNQTVNIPSTWAATSTSTGALTVGGGVGIGGALYIANTGDVSANIGAYQTYANVYPGTATTFTVTNAGAGAYVINSESNPALYLVRGQKYNFSVNASGHPFWIKTAASTGTGDQYNTGVTNNGTAVGLITFEVPLTAPDVLYYICQFHSSMNGQLRIVNFASIDANIGTLFLGNASTNANLGAFQAYANTKIGNNSNGNLVVVATTTSTDTTTGALVVGGGAGIAGNAYVGGNIVVTSNASANKFYTTEGLYWSGNGVAFSSGGGGTVDYVASATAPVSPDDGDFWYQTTTGILFQYMSDGTTSYWFDVQTQSISGVSYSDANVQAYVNTTVNILSPFLLAGM